MIKKRDSELSALAPHAEPQWVDDFVIEQRLLGVPGDRIGDALATVDAHLFETGESAADAFGPAEEYARALAESEGKESSGPGVDLVASVTLGLLGVILLPRAFERWLYDATVAITVGDLVVGAVLAVIAATILFFSGRALRFILDHTVLAVLAFPALIAVFVAVFMLLRDPVLHLPAAPVAVLSALALGISAWLDWRRPADLVKSPWGARRQPSRAARALPALLLPAFALLLCLVVLIPWLAS